MKKLFKNILLFILLILLLQIFSVRNAIATEDPLSKPNNIFGIHILFPEEIEEAAKLIDSNGGDWGYVTIPIQAGDKDIAKWQSFMDKARTFHVIPIIRLSTEEYFFQKGVWRIPSYYDIVDFANFLNSLNWPTKNRYIVLFNEINRYDEWGGESPNPFYYAEIVSFSYDTFKDKSKDFFIILGGFDNASVTNGIYINEFDFLKKMVSYDGKIFEKIDGFASHSYPNPAFSQPPSATKKMGTYTYNFEYNYINSFTSAKKPAFITETGWDANLISEDKVAQYYQSSFEDIWGKDSRVVAVTPFLFNGGSQFEKFSFLKNGQHTSYYETFKEIKKVRGEPILNIEQSVKKYAKHDLLPEKKFEKTDLHNPDITVPSLLRIYVEMIFGIRP